MRFAMTGVTGYVAPRHLNAIKQTGNQLIMALDPISPGRLLENYFPNATYFNSSEQFENRLRRSNEEMPAISYVSICSPTHLHDSQIRLALNSQSHAICEKPIVIDPNDLARLQECEARSGRRIFTILQLRSHDSATALRAQLSINQSEKAKVTATFITARDQSYFDSWKADEGKSGGLAMNIGVHLFDLLIWLFGRVERSKLHLSTARRLAGALEMERATVQWYLSIAPDDLPAAPDRTNSVLRKLEVNGSEFDFSNGFDDLHTRAYKMILEGRGHGVEEARPSIELVHLIRNSTISNRGNNRHPIIS